MPLTFSCTCGAALTAPESSAGREMRCRHCGAVVVIGGGSAAPVPAAPAPAAPAPAAPVTPQVVAGAASGAATATRMPVGNGGVIGRDRATAAFFLDHPHVSRNHARLIVLGGRVALSDLGAANGTMVNGQRIDRPTYLEPGDRIDIGPYSLEFDGEALSSSSRADNIELAAVTVDRVVTDTTTKRSLTLLNRISVVVRPREFVAILGPSGSGKTTLLTILSGRSAPDGGLVLVNERDLHANFAAIKQDIAVVPQKDILHDTLTVESALSYTAELRMTDASRDERLARLKEVLAVVGLTERRKLPIRSLSGGQLKRASLANELLAQPSLLFLDEVTSGLDEKTDRDIMELFRSIAEEGKTVVCITHSLANVEATCHLVVVLTVGGRLAFVGTPEEARDYFSIPRLGDIYDRLERATPENWQAKFQAHALHKRYVNARLPSGKVAGRTQASADERRGRVNPFRQAWILTRRYLAVWRGDAAAVATLLGQSLLIALLIGLVFGRLSGESLAPKRVGLTNSMMFLLCVSAFWLGCNTAAKELVKERVIYRRESDFNVRPDCYYFSKLFVLTFATWIQVSLLFAIVRLWCDPAGNAMQQAMTLWLLAVDGVALGLVISAFARTEEVAIALVPVAVFPQIILAGVIAPLSGISKWIAYGLVSTYWGQRAVQATLPAADQKLLDLESAQLGPPMLVVAAHTVVFATIALVTLALGQRASRPR